MNKIHPSEITPEHIYLSRRQFIAAASAIAAGAVLSACCVQPPASAPISFASSSTADLKVSKDKDELGDLLTSYENITNYNNFYEFSLSKESVAMLSKDFKTNPWTIQVGGLVNQPRAFSMDDLLQTCRMECLFGGESQ